MKLYIVVTSTGDGLVQEVNAYTSLTSAQEGIKQDMLNMAQSSTEYHFCSEQIGLNYDIFITDVKKN